MIGHKVHYNTQTDLVGSPHKVVKLGHSLCWIVRQVTTDRIIICYGVWRTRLTLQHLRRGHGYAPTAIVGGRCLLQQAGVPHAIASELLDAPQSLFIEVAHLAATVLFDRAVAQSTLVCIAKQSNQGLVDDQFLVGSRHIL